eukprot:RCo020378
MEELLVALPREVTEEELHMLQLLTPQGMAKVNADLARGVDMETTLHELQAVLRDVESRREETQRALPEEAQALLRSMDRPPTGAELTMLKEVPPTQMLLRINLRLQAGECFTDAVESLAAVYLDCRLAGSAQRLSSVEHRPVTLSRLCPTAVPTTGNPVSPTMVKPSANGMRVGLSPVATWFDELVMIPPRCASSPECSCGHGGLSTGGLSPSESSPDITPTMSCRNSMRLRSQQTSPRTPNGSRKVSFRLADVPEVIPADTEI